MMETLLELVKEFFLTGLFAVGGGLATLPFLYDIGARTKWFTSTDVMNMIAISESTPGPIGINMATYGGFLALGAVGGLVASLSLVLPSVIIVLIISKVLDKFRHSRIVESVFSLLRPASCALIAAALISVAKVTFLDIPENNLFADINQFIAMFDFIPIILGGIFFILIRKVKLHPIIYLVAAAILGIVLEL